MGRGKHNKTGYPWGVSRHERTQVNVPKVIAKEVRQAAIEIWERRKTLEHFDDGDKSSNDNDDIPLDANEG